MGSRLNCRLIIASLTLHLGPCGHSVAFDGPYAGDVAYSNLGFNESAPDEVGTIGLGVRSVFRGWIYVSGVHV